MECLIQSAIHSDDVPVELRLQAVYHLHHHLCNRVWPFITPRSAADWVFASWVSLAWWRVVSQVSQAASGPHHPRSWSFAAASLKLRVIRIPMTTTGTSSIPILSSAVASDCNRCLGAMQGVGSLREGERTVCWLAHGSSWAEALCFYDWSMKPRWTDTLRSRQTPVPATGKPFSCVLNLAYCRWDRHAELELRAISGYWRTQGSWYRIPTDCNEWRMESQPYSNSN